MPIRAFSHPLHRGIYCSLPRQFHSTPLLRRSEDDGRNYYEILGVGRNATVGEIKKQFYHLSKTHHPDHNPTDPNASTRFVSISTAYATLSKPSSRTTYDQTIFPAHAHSYAPTHPQGSHFSGSAGGRPASGLSRRRTQFRGPPASFYRSGGWGMHSAKREEHSPFAHRHPEHQRPQNYHPDSSPGSAYNQGSQEFEGYGGMGFNAQGHLQSQRNFDERRKARMQRRTQREVDSELEGEGRTGLFFVLSISLFLVIVGFGGPSPV